MKEFDIVVALRDLHGGLVKAGEVGAILDVYDTPVGYIVEFDDIENDDVFLVTCHPGDIALKDEEVKP